MGKLIFNGSLVPTAADLDTFSLRPKCGDDDVPAQPTDSVKITRREKKQRHEKNNEELPHTVRHRQHIKSQRRRKKDGAPSVSYHRTVTLHKVKNGRAGTYGNY